MPKRSWGAIIRGAPSDLEDWVFVLKEPFDPWLEVHGDDTVLRSHSLDESSSPEEVRGRALTQIERLNGAIAVSQGTGPIQFDSVVEFLLDGSLHRTVFGVGVARLGRVKLRAVGQVLGQDGKLLPTPPPQPSEVQSWMTLVDGDALLEDALIYFGRRIDWFDIYKTLECLMLRFGGGEKAFLALNWAPADEVERLKRTANWARHARRRFDPPENPMALNDARELTAQLLRRALVEAHRAGDES